MKAKSQKERGEAENIFLAMEEAASCPKCDESLLVKTPHVCGK